jgi:catechol 2,3-dioxygenase-like lactoylglutathione lyase family enzyme
MDGMPGCSNGTAGNLIFPVYDGAFRNEAVVNLSDPRLNDALIPRRRLLAWAATAAGGAWLAGRGRALQKLLPLNTSGLDHLSITVPDAKAAATFYGRIFDPQVFHERTGVQRYYVRLGSAYLAFGPQANRTPYIDHIAAAVIDFPEADFGNPEVKEQITAGGLAAPPGVLPMLADPDNLRLQLVNAMHGLFDTLMPGGRVSTEPAAVTPIGLDHIIVSVSDLEKSTAHYRKLFGQEMARERSPERVWFRLADTRLGLEPTPEGQKPAFSHFCVKVAGFDRKAVAEKLRKLSIHSEAGSEKGTLRFRDLHDLPVEAMG